MLYGIDPLVGPDLLHALRSMGHGDEVAIVDANFPAASFAQRLIHLESADAIRVVDAILRLMPLDRDVTFAASVMQVIDQPETSLPIYDEFKRTIAAHQEGIQMATLERSAFYERARACFAVIATGELRAYGNLILSKGVIETEGV
ncbi:RbsD/FucU family protein [Mesorhizobium argentiipisi]|uniref:D-ribose pyranase n=1 Tax=Mesorhizobium argentiipisi TaxID=3015175 RepID=A0ABU8KBP8_9HYPH